jgi:hypothetical protein
LHREDHANGENRNLSDPPDQGDPDRVGSALYVPWASDPNDDNDYGGVHANSGVNNKLCFLLTDGTGTNDFNGRTIAEMGMERVADLYYDANTHLLTSGATWDDLFQALRQAAVNLGWTDSERMNLYHACRAVEIGTPDDIYIDNSILCAFQTGAENCGFFAGPYPTVTEGVDEAHPGDRLYIRAGSYDESVTFSEWTIVRSVDGTAVIGE